jgi:ABC-type nitrate/sulfonate/bicarbonate transport system substrate-binding protein
MTRAHRARRARTSSIHLTVARGAVLAVAMLLLLVACGGDDNGAEGTNGETAAGVDIPRSTVRFAFYPCCADHAILSVPIEEGFFDDVGIDIRPQEGHQYTLFDQIVPSMQRNDHDVAGMFIQGYLQTLPSFGQDIPPIMFYDIYVGYAILMSPQNDARTAEEIMEQEGVSFPEAARMAIDQIGNDDVHTPPHGQVQPPYPDVFMSYADKSYPDDLNLQFLEDPRILTLSTTPGRMSWAIPYAAPVLVQMMREGWKPLINVNMLFEHDNESEQADRMRELVGSTGLIAQRSWVEENEDTALRFVSAIYRTLDFVSEEDTKEQGFSTIANLINATQGQDLIPEDIGTIFDEVDPLFRWEDQGAQLWEDESAPYHVRSSLTTQINALIENETLPDQEYDLDRFLVAEQLYERMKSLQEEADGLFRDAEDADLDDEQQGLVEQARQHYEWYNFLDAARFLRAALEE